MILLMVMLHRPGNDTGCKPMEKEQGEGEGEEEGEEGEGGGERKEEESEKEDFVALSQEIEQVVNTCRVLLGIEKH